ncbi:MAG: hypothetical protein A2Z95_00350 [Gallionellales bacterium GWA2_60_18]|nr:MAG: hypothetical protein A2Z95_00350 [Gallionellales bacterium GWA2_60_18]
MTKIRYWRYIGLCGFAASSFSAIAQEQTPGNPSPKWGAHVDVEAKLGSKRSLGEADLFLPIAQDGSTLYFANLRGRFDDNSSNEGNFGFGARRMQPSGWNLGAYGYFDHRRTDIGNTFNQATLGAEALGRDWDFRANGYLPLGTKARELGTASTAAISGAAVQVTTTTREERALKGFDAEVGWRTPLFDSEAHRQLRLYLGGYRFSDAGVTVEGPRLRAELAMEELSRFGKGAGLFLSAEAQDDNTRGSQTFLSLRLRIPLGGEVETHRLSVQERRMTAPVMRDVDIVTQSRVASTLVETATQTSGGQTFTVLNSATTTGAALPGAVAAAGAGSTVILSGTFNTAAATISLQANQTLTGTSSVRTASGHVATLNTGAAVHATNATDTVIVNSNGTLSGLTITNTYSGGGGGRAVQVAGGAGGVTIANNTLSVSQSGANGAVALLFGNGTSGTISGNTITATGSGGATTMTALGMNGGGGITVTVTGNSMSASGGGTANNMAWVTGATINAGSTGNTRGSGACNGAPASGSIVFTDLSTCP